MNRTNGGRRGRFDGLYRSRRRVINKKKEEREVLLVWTTMAEWRCYGGRERIAMLTTRVSCLNSSLLSSNALLKPPTHSRGF